MDDVVMVVDFFHVQFEGIFASPPVPEFVIAFLA